MGRKNHITKESKYGKNAADESDDEYIDDKIENTNKNLRQMEGIFYMQQAMINYVNETALPLCDYLDFNAVEDFVDFLIQS